MRICILSLSLTSLTPGKGKKEGREKEGKERERRKGEGRKEGRENEDNGEGKRKKEREGEKAESVFVFSLFSKFNPRLKPGFVANKRKEFAKFSFYRNWRVLQYIC